MTDIQKAIHTILARQPLSREAMRSVMQQIMTGQATPAQIGGFLVAMAMKGETVAELAAAVGVMRDLVTPVIIDHPHLVDTCGTGGDHSGTFNISTASALVVAAAGGCVAKHGNRSVSSQSGSADVLEALGVRIDLPPEKVTQCIKKLGVGFLFAPTHHPAMKHAVIPRRELGVRTFFNLLGPLTNPAGAPHQIVGVFEACWVKPIAEVLKETGSLRALVVHAKDGLDEISCGEVTTLAELKAGEIFCYDFSPEQAGIPRTPIENLKVKDVAESKHRIEAIFANQFVEGSYIVALNAGAALYISGLAVSLPEGVKLAKAAIEDGRAANKLKDLVKFTQTDTI